MTRITVLALSLLIASPAQAIPCWIVRKAVSDYGEAAVESWARGKGYTEADIAKAKRCLR